MEKLIEKLKENERKFFTVVNTEELEFVDYSDFESAQDGFRYNPVLNEPIEDWKTMIGENFYVIGFEAMLGDPIIADAGTEGFPIYNMMHDDWESLRKVANSFDEFMENLSEIEKLINEHKGRDSIYNLVKKLDDENNTNGFYELICFDVLDEEGFYYDDFDN